MNKIEQAKELLSNWSKPNSAGIAVSVIKNNEIIFEHAGGMAELQHNVPVTMDTKFHIASCTKMFIATACMKLQQDGLLSINSPTIQYLDNLDIPEDVTIKHLLSMTSGLYEGYDLFPICGSFNDAYHSPEDHIDMLNASRAVNAKAGDNFIYNNSNYMILARIIENLSGKNLDRYLDEIIWKPMGMDNTSGDEDTVRIIENLAYPYYKENNELSKGAICRTSLGNGHAISNISDLKKWITAIKSRNCNDINISQLFEPTVTTDGTSHTYGMGMKILKYKNISLHGHGGLFEGGYACSILYSPELDASFIVLSNSSDINPRKIILSLIDLFFEDSISPIIPPTNDEHYAGHSLNRIDGEWVNPETGEVIKLEYRNNDLELNLKFYDIEVNLPRLINGSFTNETLLTRIQITPLEENGEFILSVNWGGENNIYVNKSTMPPPSIHPQEYIGSYHNVEIDATHHITINNGILYIRFGGIHNNSKKMELVPIAKDIYSTNIYMGSQINEDYSIKFERERFSDTISQISISTERTKSLILRRMKTF